jgi:hypothetical protein
MPSTPTPSRCTRSRSGRWRCITPGARRTPGCARSSPQTLYMNAATAAARHRRRRLGLGHQHHGRVKAQAKLMEGVNPTRSGPGTPSASARAPGASTRRMRPKRRKGFLLNHLISELLPPSAKAATAIPTADPVTGQAAWYDLRVRLEKAAAPKEQFERARSSSALKSRRGSRCPAPPT